MFINPKQFVDEWDIRPGMKVADFGCGSGHNSIEIARRAGADGRVYAFDVQEEPLSAMKSRIAAEHIYNIEIRRADLELERGTGLADSILDFVVISNILFQTEDKEALVREAFRVLRPEGRVIVIDWDDSFASMGPPLNQRVNRDEVNGIFLNVGFVFDREVDVEESHYGLIFRKK